MLEASAPALSTWVVTGNGTAMSGTPSASTPTAENVSSESTRSGNARPTVRSSQSSRHEKPCLPDPAARRSSELVESGCFSFATNDAWNAAAIDGNWRWWWGIVLSLCSQPGARGGGCTRWCRCGGGSRGVVVAVVVVVVVVMIGACAGMAVA